MGNLERADDVQPIGSIADPKSESAPVRYVSANNGLVHCNMLDQMLTAAMERSDIGSR
jgi:hypothetical protein